MVTHFETLEADLARYYQLDLPAAVWGPEPVSARRLGVLIRHLPPECATARARHDGRQWGNLEELVATTAELIDLGNRLFRAAHSDPGTRQPGPIQISRPWDPPPPERPVMATSEEMVAFFGRRGNGSG